MIKIQKIIKIFIKLFDQRFIKYKDFLAEDFVSDDCFCKWIHEPMHYAERFFWQAFIEKFPEKQPEIESAKEVIQFADAQEEQPINFLSDFEINMLWNTINTTITNK